MSERTQHAFTPEPWSCETGLPFNTVQCGDGDSAYCWVVSYECGEPISEDQERMDADARLLSAAPKLLAACKAAESFLRMIGEPAPPHPWMQLRDAINRATGAF